MDDAVRAELLAMQEEDLRVREELASDGSLYLGYHARMEDVHRRNAARLREIIAEHGWPGHSLVGEDGAKAAWLIAQHSIGEPELMRAALELVRDGAARGDVPAWQAAYLEDRIRVFEGRPQRYATQFDVDEHGRSTPRPIEDAEHVDARRAAVGLEPLAVQLARSHPAEPLSAEARARRDREEQVWLRSVGWRA